MKTSIIVSLAALLTVWSAVAQEIHRPWESVRSQGMGNVRHFDGFTGKEHGGAPHGLPLEMVAESGGRKSKARDGGREADYATLCPPLE